MTELKIGFHFWRNDAFTEFGVSDSGTYTFEIDGYPVNADEDLRPSEAPSWRVEDMSMSLYLLEQVTRWRLGEISGAGCCYDYVEFSIRPLGIGILEIKSYYTGDTEPAHIGICAEADFWPAFAATTDGLMQAIRRFAEMRKTEQDPRKLASMHKIAARVRPEKWENAYAEWKLAWEAGKN